jgi:hypothetical protein
VLAHDDGDLVKAELTARGDAVIARDELVPALDRAHDHRHEQAAQLDRLRERRDVLAVEILDVLANADAVKRQCGVAARRGGRCAGWLRHLRPPCVDGSGPLGAWKHPPPGI